MKYFVILSLILVGFTGSASAFEPSYTNYFSNPEFQIYKIYKNSYEFSIPYNISNAELDRIIVDCDSTAMLVYFDNIGTKGNLIINIPRALLDAKIGEQDDAVFFILDQQEVEYLEINTDSDSRTFYIPLQTDGELLEIIATSVGMFPEPNPRGVGGIDDSPYYRLVSPLKQFNLGIPFDEIQCKENLVLIQKYDGSPACVKSLTAEKLIERGSHMGLQVLTYPQYSISTGTYSGFCVGYCSTSFTITPEQIIILKTGSTGEGPLDQATQAQFSEKDWNKIVDSIDFQKFVTLPDKIGCPGCADAPVNWIEISDGNQTKKIEYENQDDIPEIKQLRTILEEITTALNSKLDQSDNKIITLDEKDKLVEIKKGEKFLVQLDSNYSWRIDIDNKTVVDSDYSDIRYSGSQAVYLAHNLGNATITGVGDPHCQSLEPPCMSPSILFQIDVKVE